MSLQKPWQQGGIETHEMLEVRETNHDDASSGMLPGHNTAHLQNGRKQIRDHLSTIAWSFLVLTIPMLIFVGVLLGLIFHYRVQESEFPFENLRLADDLNQQGAYYARISSTTLVFIASWSSSLAPALASFALALVSYPVAKRYLREQRLERQDNLLTPYQLFLTLRFLDGGGVGALFGWVKYLFRWRNQRRPQASPLATTASVSILAVVLAIAVFMSDTWLHVTTKTVNFTQINPISSSSVDYSFHLVPGCTVGNNSFTYLFSSSEACSLNIAGAATFLINGTQSTQVLNNVSDIMAVFQYNESPYTYLGMPPSDSLSNRDYTASTFGMQTQCKPVSTECNLTAYAGASTPFHCTDAFHSDLTATALNAWVMTYLTDSTMESNVTENGIHNPYYFGIAAIVNPEGTAAPLEATGLTPVPEIVTPVHGGIAFVLSCFSTLYDIEYDSVNGTITRFVTTASNDSVANIWEGAMDFTTSTSGKMGTPSLLQASTLAVFSDTAQEMADKLALSYSKVALAIGAQAVVPKPALAAQERESFLVTRVPKAPLFTLVVANLLFVIMGFVLAAIALVSAGSEVREVQARLSTKGLIADRFESARGRNGVLKMEDHFEEGDGRGSMRVGIDYIEGSGYTYKVWPNHG